MTLHGFKTHLDSRTLLVLKAKTPIPVIRLKHDSVDLIVSLSVSYFVLT